MGHTQGISLLETSIQPTKTQMNTLQLLASQLIALGETGIGRILHPHQGQNWIYYPFEKEKMTDTQLWIQFQRNIQRIPNKINLPRISRVYRWNFCLCRWEDLWKDQFKQKKHPFWKDVYPWLFGWVENAMQYQIDTDIDEGYSLETVYTMGHIHFLGWEKYEGYRIRSPFDWVICSPVHDIRSWISSLPFLEVEELLREIHNELQAGNFWFRHLLAEYLVPSLYLSTDSFPSAKDWNEIYHELETMQETWGTLYDICCEITKVRLPKIGWIK